MALILRSSVPQALMVLPKKINDSIQTIRVTVSVPVPLVNKVCNNANISTREYEECCSIILALDANKPVLKNYIETSKPIYKKVTPTEKKNENLI